MIPFDRWRTPVLAGAFVGAVARAVVGVDMDAVGATAALYAILHRTEMKMMMMAKKKMMPHIVFQTPAAAPLVR